MIFVKSKKTRNFSNIDVEYDGSPTVSTSTINGILGGAGAGTLLGLGLGNTCLDKSSLQTKILLPAALGVAGAGIGGLIGNWAGRRDKDIWREKMKDYKEVAIDPQQKMTPELLLAYIEKNKELKSKFDKLLSDTKKSGKNQESFSRAEINFLNNFSSIDELNAFAVNFGETLDKVNDYLFQNQWVLPTAGAVGGAGIGALGGLYLGDKKKSKLERALIGASIGTGAGALGGLSGNRILALLTIVNGKNPTDVVDKFFEDQKNRIKNDPETVEFERRLEQERLENQKAFDAAESYIKSQFEQFPKIQK